MTRKEVIGQAKNKICPFCGEDDFDLIGLKAHLLRWCKVFEHTDSLGYMVSESSKAEWISDYARRLLSHMRGEGVPSECRTCKKPYWYVDDEPIICPHCHPKEALGERTLKDEKP